MGRIIKQMPKFVWERLLRRHRANVPSESSLVIVFQKYRRLNWQCMVGYQASGQVVLADIEGPEDGAY